MTSGRLSVVIVGAGVAGLEGALALRALADNRVSITLLSRESEFVYRPMRVFEPFAEDVARRYPLDEIARDIGAEFCQAPFRWLDAEGRCVHTQAGERLRYDALLLALGAVSRPRLTHALNLDERRLDEQMHGLVQDLEAGYLRRLAFVVPSTVIWPLPIYELALMTARRAWESQQQVSIVLVTAEDAPLAVFGRAVSDAVGAVLDEHGIRTIASARCETPAPGRLSLRPGSRCLEVDQVVALPELFGPATPGVPKRDGRGFIPIDAYCRVPGLERVWAAGDATESGVKHGGLAAQQADTAAEGIAALAGAPIRPSKLNPELHAILVGAERPLYLSARFTGTHGSNSQVATEAAWSPPTKIVARHLSRYLQSRDHAPAR
ncbi:MAG TPA: FAD-dependent oxidoreductase [Solirubrobacteraceae bacterium]|nr:FAD-dependent oxidoreductase [Solirubrobacteraceae bacterium]